MWTLLCLFLLFFLLLLGLIPLLIGARWPSEYWESWKRAGGEGGGVTVPGAFAAPLPPPLSVPVPAYWKGLGVGWWDVPDPGLKVHCWPTGSLAAVVPFLKHSSRCCRAAGSSCLRSPSPFPPLPACWNASAGRYACRAAALCPASSYPQPLALFARIPCPPCCRPAAVVGWGYWAWHPVASAEPEACSGAEAMGVWDCSMEHSAVWAEEAELPAGAVACLAAWAGLGACGGTAGGLPCGVGGSGRGGGGGGWWRGAAGALAVVLAACIFSATQLPAVPSPLGNRCRTVRYFVVPAGTTLDDLHLANAGTA